MKVSAKNKKAQPSNGTSYPHHAAAKKVKWMRESLRDLQAFRVRVASSFFYTQAESTPAHPKST